MIAGPVSKQFLRRRNLIRAATVLMVVVLAAIALILGSQFLSRSADDEARAQKAATEARVKILAGQFGQLLNRHGQLLDQAAEDPVLADLLRDGDPAAIAEGERELAGRFEGSLRVRLLPAGINAVDNSSMPPLTYASLDMMRRAESADGAISAEVHLFGSPAQHLVMLRRLKDDGGQLLGAIHLSLDVSLLQSTLDQLDLSGGYLQLQQPVAKGPPLVLASAGDPALAGRGQEVQTRVPGSAWTLAYWASPHAPRVAVDTPPAVRGLDWTLVAGGALVLLLVTGGGVLLARRRGAAGEDGTVSYEGAVRAIMEGAHPGIERLVPDLPQVPVKARPAEVLDVSQGLEGEDITVFGRTQEAASAAAAPQAAAPAPPAAAAVARPPGAEDTQEGHGSEIPAVIFRAYDIRGVVGKTLNEHIVHEIGRAIGTEAYARGQQGIVVGRDGRNSGPELAAALIKGLRASGRDVIDIGMVPTPVLYFATHYLETGSGVMLTGSHNPKDYNGLKIMLAGETLSGEAIGALRARIVNGDLVEGAGSVQSADIGAEYIRRISEDVPVALGNALKLVVDCGNGVPGAIAPQLLRALGHDVIELYCEVDGNFPNHHPDPSQPKNLEELIRRVRSEGADLGLAFDGDGDRLGVVDASGEIIWPDRQMMLFARDVLSRNPGAEIIFDVKCSGHLKSIIEQHGGKPVMWRTGHSLIKARMKESGAPLAGEMSGHIFFKERWYGFDDALYSAARLLEILVNAKRPPAEVFAELPGGVATPELRMDVPESEHAAVMQRLVDNARFDGAEITTIDGLRVDFPDGWGLVRPSNTTPCLVLRFEGDTQEALERVQASFRELLKAQVPGVDPGF